MEDLVEEITEALPQGYWFNRRERNKYDEWVEVELPAPSDVLFLSKFSVDSSEQDKWRATINERGPHLTCAFWPYICVRNRRNVIPSYKADIPFADYLLEAMNILSPKAIVILTYKGRDNTFKDVWPKNFKIPYKEVFQDNMVEWVQALRADLKWRYHIGSQKLGNGSTDAFAVLLDARKSNPAQRVYKEITQTLKVIE